MIDVIELPCPQKCWYWSKIDCVKPSRTRRNGYSECKEMPFDVKQIIIVA